MERDMSKYIGRRMNCKGEPTYRLYVKFELNWVWLKEYKEGHLIDESDRKDRVYYFQGRKVHEFGVVNCSKTRTEKIECKPDKPLEQTR